ncbi:MAG: hypothetical protein A3F72_19625 [Bacteroidetes bacterium RIFCSPLOWO2_12_FULL_35_15]|nr:MAG: hypothetical protein A3F72_19625 [Bacteroidetes bacterium RIFCSPLOWO2_12_FULL_35_15]
MKPILVPTDFSKCSYNAAHFAIALAKETKAKIILLHVYQFPNPPAVTHITPIAQLDMQDERLKRVYEMAEFELTLHGKEELVIESEVIAGFTVEGIITASQKHDAGIIVMGTQGADGLKKIFMGSNTSNVISKSSCPVLAVPENAKYLGFNKVVFAADFHEIKSNISFEPLVEIALLFNSETLIFSVRKNESDIPSIIQAFERLNLDKVFERIPHSFHTAVSEDTAGEIDKFVNTNHIDLLVTMPQKHSYLELIFNKSITHDLVFHATVPILCLPEKKLTIEKQNREYEKADKGLN